MYVNEQCISWSLPLSSEGSRIEDWRADEVTEMTGGEEERKNDSLLVGLENTVSLINNPPA